MNTPWRPPHVYIPGQTPRHPDDLFDSIKVGLGDVPANRLNRTRAWAYGLEFLEDGFFWEAHEVLEAVWMACPPNAPERLMVQAVIQHANAQLKRKMGQEQAALRLDKRSSDLAQEAVSRAGAQVLGLDAQMSNIIHNDKRWS